MKAIDSSTLPRPALKPKPLPKPKNCLARAVYDNIAESPDELAFRRGDVLTVLEQNTNGLEGWWLCSLRGRQGICPGNRLRLLAGVYDTGGVGGTATGAPSVVSPTLRQLAKRRSWHINPNKVVTPLKVGGVYVYDVPAKSSSEAYDVPPTRSIPTTTPQHHFSNQVSNLSTSGSYDSPKSHGMESYDVPISNQMSYDVPRPHRKACSPIPPFGLKSSDKGFPQGSTEAYDSPRSQGVQDYDVPRGHEYDVVAESDSNAGCCTYDVPPSHHIAVADAYDVPPPSNRSSGVSMLSTGSSSAVSPSNSVSNLTPSLSLSSLGCGTGSNSNRSSIEHQQHEVYDIPPSETRKVGLLLSRGGSVVENSYDVPTTAAADFSQTPTKPKAALPFGMSVSMEGVYDVPPQVTRDTTMTLTTVGKNLSVDELDGKMQRLSTSSADSSSLVAVIQGSKELPLELDAAMDTLIRLQQEVQSAITKLFVLVSTNWRRREHMETKVYDVKLACIRIRNALQEFLEFAQGTLVNSTRAPDRGLFPKLAKLVRPLKDSNTIIQETTKSLDSKGWPVTELATCEAVTGIPDELDQLVACARGLTEDVRQVASFIQGNSTLLFKRSQPMIQTDCSKQNVSSKPAVQERPLPLPPPPGGKVSGGKGGRSGKEENMYENDKKDWIDDYDYVNLESKESVEKENEEIKAALPKELRKSFEDILKESQVPVKDDLRGFPDSNVGQMVIGKLDPNDRQVFQFYIGQVDTHITYLTNAIDGFLATIENNQQPKVFIGHSKFVVLSAHKLVYIGDTIHRNIINTEVRNRVHLCANALCDALKTTVQCTKTAALQFPSVIAVQEMVDSVVDISHSANEFKMIINKATRH